MSDLQSLGAKLREAREAHELSLAELEQRTRIRPRFLQAMENGQFQVIDNPLQLKGFLRSYAKAVGLDDDSVVAEYEAALAAASRQRRRRKSEATPPPPPPAPNQPIVVTRAPVSTQERQPDPALYRPDRRSWAQLILAISLLLIVVVSIGGGAFLIIRDLSNDEAGTSGQILQPVNVGEAEAVLATPTPTLFVAPTQFSPPVINPGDPINVRLTAQQRLWVQVTVDDTLAYEGMLRPGEGATYDATRSVVIKTTNAGGLQVLVNNQPYILGSGRQAVERRIPDDLGVSTSFLPPLVAPNTAAVAQMVASPTSQVELLPTEMPVLDESTPASDGSAQFSSPVVEATPAGSDAPSFTPASSDNGVVPTSTLIPTLGFATDTATPTPTAILPTATPTYTPSPFLPPRLTRTPTLDKS